MKLIDLSHRLSGQTPSYPGDPPVELTLNKTVGKDGYNAYLLNSGLHAGTHLDVPLHGFDGYPTVDSYPPDCFSGNGVLLDVRGEDPFYLKEEYDLLIDEGDIVLFYTGFDQYFGNPEKYYSEHPVISEELTGFLLKKQVKMVGSDTPSLDHPPLPAHRALLQNGIFLLENLTNLDALRDVKHFEVFALPLKIAAEGSFVRAVARVR